MSSLQLNTCTFIFLLLSISLVQEKSYGQQLQNLDFHQITPSNGLSQSTVYTIIQDSEGFMWFGTEDGLNRYDGYELTVYENDPSDSTSISGNYISKLYEDRNGTLWIGTLGAGLNRYSKETDDFTHYEVNPQNTEIAFGGNTVLDILEDSQGNLWIGKTDGLYLMDRENETFTRFAHNPEDISSMSENYVTTLFEDSRGNLWVGTQTGLNLFDLEEGTVRRFFHDPDDQSSLGGNYIYSMYESENGLFWVGTRDGGGLNLYNYETESFRHFKNEPSDSTSLSGNSVSVIAEDQNGNLWIGTENSGVNIYNREEQNFQRVSHEPSEPYGLNSNLIQSLYPGENNLFWIGTFDGGVNFMDISPSKFEHYQTRPGQPNSLTNNSVLTFQEDQGGNFWIGTDGGGLNRFDRTEKTFSAYRHRPDDSNSLSNDTVVDIIEDDENRLWILNYRGGINIFDPQTGSVRHITDDPEDPDDLNTNDVWRLIKTSDGTIWAAVTGLGLVHIDPEEITFTHYSNDPDDSTSLNNNFVTWLYEDSQQRLWMGTSGGGLDLMNRQAGTFRHFTVENGGLSHDFIETVNEDQNNTLWVGTRGGGLNRIDLAELRLTDSYTTEDGLPNNIIHGIEVDDNGNVWLSTNQGLSEFDPYEETFTNYDLSDGLQSMEFRWGSSYTDSEGYMYFGGVNGFDRFHPDSVLINEEVPEVVLTGFQIFNRPVPIGSDSPLKKEISQAEEVVLPYTASVFSFEFAALNFSPIKSNQYSYMLEGFDSDWNYVGQQRTATYTNIDPGEYIFRVRATNNDGVWGEEAASVAVVITPPFWQTAWFYMLSGLLLTGIIVGGYRYRTRFIREQNRRLEEEVQVRTTELAHRNRDLQQALEDLEKTREELVDKAHKAGMAELATGVLHNVGNILNSVTTSTAMIDDIIRSSSVEGLFKANKLLKEHEDDLEKFIVHDPKGKKLLSYYLALEESVKKEQKKLVKHNDRLKKKVELINDVISAQQSIAKTGSYDDLIHLDKVVDDALMLQTGSNERHNIQIKKELDPVDPIKGQKTKLMHIIINLYRNAKEALKEVPVERRSLGVRLFQDEEHVYLSFSDNGSGIKPENVNKIFTHGFTTKKEGHGFGLHSCANYMAEMDGSIEADSNGPGKGSTFTLTFPRTRIKNEKKVKEDELET